MDMLHHLYISLNYTHDNSAYSVWATRGLAVVVSCHLSSTFDNVSLLFVQYLFSDDYHSMPILQPDLFHLLRSCLLAMDAGDEFPTFNKLPCKMFPVFFWQYFLPETMNCYANISKVCKSKLLFLSAFYCYSFAIKCQSNN